MSRETLHLMLKLNPEDLDTQVALQCAPLLTGMKISNLLTVGRSKRAAGSHGPVWLQGMGFGGDFKPCVHQI